VGSCQGESELTESRTLDVSSTVVPGSVGTQPVEVSIGGNYIRDYLEVDAE